MAPFLLLWLALQSASVEAMQHLQQGVEALKKGKLDAAIVQLREATELEPKLAEAFAELGEAYMEKHDYGAAIVPLKRALELNPDLAPAHRLLGYALLARGYAAEAVPHLQQVGEQAALGIAEIETRQYPEAVANLNAALAKDPKDPDLLYYLGRASGLLSKSAIDTLVAAYPDSARTHQAMAENYLVLRQMENAEKEYTQALQLRPELPNLHLELGQVHAGTAQWTKAEEQFRAEAKLQPGKAEAHYRLGAALLQEGNFHEARVELQRADGLRPEMPEILYSLGKAALLDGDPALAKKAWTKLIEIEGQGSFAAKTHFELANLYRKQGNAAKARHEIQEYQKLQNPAPQPQSPPA